MPLPSGGLYPSGTLYPGEATTDPASTPAPKPGEWTFVLADENGREVREVHLARFRKWGPFVRNGASQVTLVLDLDDPAALDVAAILRNGVPRLRVYREDDVDDRPSFYGYWHPQRERAGDGDEGLALTFRSPFAGLAFRHTRRNPGVSSGPLLRTFSNRDAGEIAWDLISETNSESPTGLGRGTVEATVSRDRTYEWKQLAEAIVALTNVRGGFDFSETFVHDPAEPDTLALLNVHARLGQNKSKTVLFEYGDGTLGNVLGVRRSTSLPANRVVVLGEEGMFGEAEDTDSQATFGLFELVVSASDGTTEQTTLDAKAADLLRPFPVRVVEFTPDPVLSPSPGKDYVVGDTVGGRCREGALSFDESVRVNGYAVNLDNDGNESSHELTFEVQGGG